MTSWEYSAENEKLLDVMAGNGRLGKNESPIVWETRAPCHDIHLTDADCFARTTDGDLILHNHVQVNCLYSAVLQLICLRDSISEYGGVTLPTPTKSKSSYLTAVQRQRIAGALTCIQARCARSRNIPIAKSGCKEQGSHESG